MKTQFTAALVALLFLCSQALHSQTNAAPSTNPGGAPDASATTPQSSLLSNGDFSSATKDPAWPDDWTHPAGATWESENGTHFLRLTPPQPGKTVLVYRQMEVPNPPPAGLELRFQVRYTDVVPGAKPWFDARVMGHFKDANGNVLKPEMSAPDFRKTSKGWETRDVFMKVPTGAVVFELMPSMLQATSGTLDLSDVQIFPATEAQLPKPPPIIPSVTMVPADPSALPPELHVAGNRLETAAGQQVWLQGLCLDSMEWSGKGEHILQSIGVATDTWKANVIRLPVKNNFWFGRGPYQKKGEGGMAYRQMVDAAVNEANAKGAYLVLDLHCFGPPLPEHVDFWKDAAVRYKNNPGVIFEIFNEPHSMSWKIWRDGGSLSSKENEHTNVNVKENNEQISGDSSVGMQALVDAVRSTGAKNLIIAGGLDWGYDLSGVVNGFALTDPPGNDGIMYSSHIYPWKKDWQHNTLDAAAKYPIFVGEVGTPPDWSTFAFIPMDQRTEDLSKGEWAPDMIGLIQKYKLNWTGFSFHPKCGPCVISDWNYTPTPYWGAYVKDALAGKQFGIKRMR
jgi:endoglucanase